MLAVAPTLASGVSFASLKPQDVSAVCRELGLPLPTPDVPLDAIAESAGLTALDVYVKLERCTSIDAMIAAAALRGSVKVLPRDSRLSPTPHRLRWDQERGTAVAAPTDGRERAHRAARAARPASSVEDPGMPADDHVVVEIGECESAPGSKRAIRFAAYKIGRTVSDLRAAGLKGSDIRRHIADGVVKFGARAAS